MTLTTVMISCIQRQAARDVTIAQLRALGLQPTGGYQPDVYGGAHLSACSPWGTNYGNADASKRALEHARAMGGDCLFVEDDIDVSPALLERLTEARAANRVTYMYVHDGIHDLVLVYGREMAYRIRAGARIPPGLYEFRTNQRLFHAQCVYLPKRALDALDLSDMLERKRPIDAFLTEHLMRVGEFPLVALPHPVQHRNDRTARNPEDGRDHRNVSWSYERGVST